MRKLCAMLMVLAFAGVAFADAPIDRASTPIYTAVAQDLSSAALRGSFDGVAYSNMELGTNYAVIINPGEMEADDYESIVPIGDTLILSEYSFVGGVTAANGILWFDFYDDEAAYVDGFGVQFPQAGNYIWTITISEPFVVPNAGYHSIEADDTYGNTTGKWFLNSEIPTVGSTTDWPGYIDDDDVPLNFKFELVSVPEPATLALLGLGALALIRRR